MAQRNITWTDNVKFSATTVKELFITIRYNSHHCVWTLTCNPLFNGHILTEQSRANAKREAVAILLNKLESLKAGITSLYNTITED